MGSVVGLLVFVLSWYLVADDADHPSTLPRPEQVASAFIRMARSGELWSNAVSSLQRVAAGLAIAATAGSTVSLLAFGPRLVNSAVRAPLGLLRHIPPIAWIPIAIGWFGIGFRSAVAVVVVSVFCPFTIAAIEAMSRARATVADVTELHRLRRRHTLLLALPAALPEIASALRLAVGYGWTSVIAAELISAQSGLGYIIEESRLSLAFDNVGAAMLAIGLCGLALSLLAAGLERLTMRRFRPDLAAVARQDS